MAELSPFDQINQLSKQMSFTSPETEQDRRAMFAQMRSKAGLKERSSVLRDVIGRGAIGQGLAMGAGDELEAYARSLASGKPYEEELNKVRSDIAVASAERPGSMLLGELGGAIAQIPAAMLVSGGTAAPAAAARTAGLATRLLEGAKTGALVGGGMGGVEGFFKGEGGAGARLENAATSAALGGAIGGGFGAALPIGAGVIQQFRRTPEELAASRAMSVLSEDKLTPDELLALYRARQASGVKPELPMEVAPKGGAIVAESKRLAQAPGGGRGEIGEFIEARSLGQTQRLTEDIESAIGGPQKNMFLALDDFSEKQKTLARPLYKEVDPKPARTTELDEILKDVPEDIFKRIKRTTGVGREKYQPILKVDDSGNVAIRDYTYSEIDKLQRKLADAETEAFRVGNNDDARYYGQVRDTILDQATKQEPKYQKARSIWAGEEDARRALASGQNIFNQRQELTAREISKMSAADKEAYKVGIFDAFQSIMLRGTATQDVTRAFQTGRAKLQMEAALKAVTDDPAYAKQITDRLFSNISREAIMAKAPRTLGGSQTAPLQQQERQFIEQISPLASAASDLATGSPLGFLGRIASGIGERYKGGITETKRGKTNEALSKLMFAKSEAELKRELDNIQSLLAKKGQYGEMPKPLQLAPGLLGGLLGSR
jgi:hypothetical protein